MGKIRWMALAAMLYAAVAQAQVFDVRDFGAVGDGATDNSPALQAALSAVPVGSRLTFSAGTYCFASQVNVTKAGVWISGTSEIGTVLAACAGSAGLTVLNVNANNFHMERVGIENKGTAAAARFLYFNAIGLFVDHVVANYAKGFSAAAFQIGADGDNAIDVHLTDVKFTAFNVPTSVNAVDVWAANVTGMTEERVFHQDGMIGLQVGTASSTGVVSVSHGYCALTTNTAAVCYDVRNADNFVLSDGDFIARNQTNRIVTVERAQSVSIVSNHVNGNGQLDYMVEVTQPTSGRLWIVGNIAERMNKYLLKCNVGETVTLIGNVVPSPGLGPMDPAWSC